MGSSMKNIILCAAALILCGCDSPYRNSPAQQVEDYKICKDGGMRPYSSGFAEIKCAP